MIATTLSLFLLGAAPVAAVHAPAGPLAEAATRASAPAAADTVPFPLLGTVRPRHAREIPASNWSVGGETMDRDYTVYDNWKQYLGPLGAKQVRLQAGWMKTEKEKGVYDFAWLDHIIDDVIAQGVEPWLQTSYGNSIYEGGGTPYLDGGMPTSEEGLQAWDRWVRALARRYSGRVNVWEVWNEPNDGVASPEVYARLYIRTAEIIRDEIPDATLYALSLGNPDAEYTRQFLEYLRRDDKLHLVDEITYHGYATNPDESYEGTERRPASVRALREVVGRFSDRIRIRQGEQGAPSTADSQGAMGSFPWTEDTQTKWVLRRMLGDLGRDIPSSVFQMIDMLYSNRDSSGGWRTYGLLRANPDKTVAYAKPSYRAVQAVTSVFDHTLRRIPGYPYRAELEGDLALFAYRRAGTDAQVVTIWSAAGAPSNSNDRTPTDFVFPAGAFEEPVYVDLREAKVYAIPADRWSRRGTEYTFRGIPVYDSPILIADRSTVELAEAEPAGGR